MAVFIAVETDGSEKPQTRNGSPRNIGDESTTKPYAATILRQLHALRGQKYVQETKVAGDERKKAALKEVLKL